MAAGQGYKLYRSLVEKQVVIPYIQNAFADTTRWPDSSVMTIDNPNRHDSHQDDYYHPSIHADKCATHLYHLLHPELRVEARKEQKSFTSVMTPLMGTAVHTIIQQKLIVDEFVKPEDVEVAVVNEEVHWRGHIDLIFRDELVDIKSMYGKKFQFQTEALDHWKTQVACYMDATGKDSAVILLVELGWPYNMREIRINKDQKLIDSIYEKWRSVTAAIQADTPPVHEGCENRYCPIGK